jgi:hypothetical protein
MATNFRPVGSNLSPTTATKILPLLLESAWYLSFAKSVRFLPADRSPLRLRTLQRTACQGSRTCREMARIKSQSDNCQALKRKTRVLERRTLKSVIQRTLEVSFASMYLAEPNIEARTHMPSMSVFFFLDVWHGCENAPPAAAIASTHRRSRVSKHSPATDRPYKLAADRKQWPQRAGAGGWVLRSMGLYIARHCARSPDQWTAGCTAWAVVSGGE